jgi:hypothetical protein
MDKLLIFSIRFFGSYGYFCFTNIVSTEQFINRLGVGKEFIFGAV